MFIEEPYPLDELAERVREHFHPSAAELRLKEAREQVRRGLAAARRPLRRGIERVLESARR
jgi:hypothetical protein